MTLFMCPSGPLLRYENGVLRVEDLNPEMKTKWRMTRGERFMTGLRFVLSTLLK
jgi:hypothetical protein